MNRYGVSWEGMACHGGMARHGVMGRYGMPWSVGMIGTIQLAWSRAVRTAQHGMVRYGMAWHGTAWEAEPLRRGKAEPLRRGDSRYWRGCEGGMAGTGLGFGLGGGLDWYCYTRIGLGLLEPQEQVAHVGGLEGP